MGSTAGYTVTLRCVFENALYPGVADALPELCRAGHVLQIVTAKPAVSARRVAAHFGIDRFFRALRGPGLSARHCDKAELVAAALVLAGGNHDPAVMVGDRAVDVLAARQHRVRAVAAGWGYGSREELQAAGAEYVAETVPDLVRWVHTVS